MTGEYETPGCSIREVTITGTHKGEYCGVQPMGKAIRIELAAFYVFGTGKDMGKLVGERVYAFQTLGLAIATSPFFGSDGGITSCSTITTDA